MRDEVPGLHGTHGLVAAMIGAALATTLVTGGVFHWLPLTLAIIVGLKAVQIINRR